MKSKKLTVNPFVSLFVFLLILLFPFNGTFSQIVFHKSFHSLGDNLFGRKVLRTSDGGSAIVAGKISQSWNSAFIKVSNIGSPSWGRSYSHLDSTLSVVFNDVVENPDKGFTLVGSSGNRPVVMRTDAFGDTLWTREFEDSNLGSFVLADRIVVSSTGDYIIGVTNWQGYIVMKMGPSGNLKWSRIIQGSGNGSDIAISKDDGIIISGVSTPSGTPYWDAFLMKLDSAGNFLWQKYYGGNAHDQFYSVIENPDGSIIASGHSNSYSTGGSDWDCFVIKTDPNGDVLWAKTIGGGGTDSAYDLVRVKNGDIVIGGPTTSFPGLNSFMIRLDQNGDTIWTRFYTDISNISSLVLDEVENVLLGTGATYNDIILLQVTSQGRTGCNYPKKSFISSFQNINDSTILQVVSDPVNFKIMPRNVRVLNFAYAENVVCDTIVGLEGANIDHPEIEVYPNPVHDLIRFTVNHAKNIKVNVHVVDIQGKTVYESVLNSGSELLIDTHLWPKGVFIAKVEFDHGITNWVKIIK